MKLLPLLLCLLALGTASLSAAETTSTKKKRSTPAPAKAKTSTSDDSAPPTKPFITPAPTKKKASAATEDDDATPAPAKKKSTTAASDATPSPTKKKKTPVTDEDAPPAKKKKPPVTDQDETSSSLPPRNSTPPKDDPEESSSQTSSTKSPSSTTPAPKTERAPAATLEPAELTEFAAQPERVQQLLAAALALTKLNLTYTFGSADPSRGGMDCSGTIYHLLRAQGFETVPRDSSSQYEWTRKAGRFFSVVSTQPDGFEFNDLQPGDLMFWTGTYQTGRDIPISHVMLYLGREKKTGKRVMFGASDGRSYAGVQRWGVSVFDFKMPKADPNNPDKRVDFVGYAPIPGLRTER